MDEDKPFAEIIEIELSPGDKPCRVKSARQAADLLASADWPGERDALHRDALETCLKVLDGHRSTEDAHQALLALAQARGILRVSKPDAKQEGQDRIPFDASLRIRLGDDSNIRTVKSVRGASEILIDWPAARRGPFYQSAREVVEAAIEGRATAAQAREAFVALADHAGILVDGQG